MKEKLQDAAILGVTLFPCGGVLFPIVKYGVLSSKGMSDVDVFKAIRESPFKGSTALSLRLAQCNSFRIGGMFAAQEMGLSDNQSVIVGAAVEGFGLAPLEARELRAALHISKPTLAQVVSVGTFATLRGILPLYAVKNAVLSDSTVADDFIRGVKAGLLSSPLQKLVIESAIHTNPLAVLSASLLSLNPMSFVKMAGARSALVGSVTAVSGFVGKLIKEERGEKSIV